MFVIPVVLGLIIIFYYVLIKPLRYWENLGVKQHTVIEILRHYVVSLFKQASLVDLINNFYESFSDYRYFGVYQPLGRALIVKDADLIKKITVKDFDHFVDHVQFSPGNEPLWERNLFSLKGEKWKSMRSILSPSFTTSKMKMMFNLMLESTDKITSYFEEESDNNKCVVMEMKDIFQRYANDVIASIAFGYSCDSLRERDNLFYTKSKDILPNENFIQNLKGALMFLFPEIAKFFGIKFLPVPASNFFYDIIKANVKEREEKGIMRPDMIHLMLEEKKARKLNGEKEQITDVDITANAMLFFFAGFESVSALMAFMAYELAVNDDIQKRLQEEVDETLKKCEGTVNYDALMKMTYMDMVISETLRKWPNSIITDRICTKPYDILPEKPGEVTVRLNKGDIVLVPMFAMQRDAKNYSNPERFDPERFNEENKSNVNSYAYIPFGVGPRVCIATRFALMEVKLLFFQILSKFDIVVVKKTPIPLTLAKSAFRLYAEKGFWLGLKSRN